MTHPDTEMEKLAREWLLSQPKRFWNDRANGAKSLMNLLTQVSQAAEQKERERPYANIIADAIWLHGYPGSVPPAWFVINAGPRDDSEAQSVWDLANVIAQAIREGKQP